MPIDTWGGKSMLRFTPPCITGYRFAIVRDCGLQENSVFRLWALAQANALFVLYAGLQCKLLSVKVHYQTTWSDNGLFTRSTTTHGTC